ncbi:hypothetical protein [Longimycelium tulufanense]|nr:hypothetical protein [Longimycelium tulufanense]
MDAVTTSFGQLVIAAIDAWGTSRAGPCRRTGPRWPSCTGEVLAELARAGAVGLGTRDLVTACALPQGRVTRCLSQLAANGRVVRVRSRRFGHRTNRWVLRAVPVPDPASGPAFPAVERSRAAVAALLNNHAWTYRLANPGEAADVLDNLRRLRDATCAAGHRDRLARLPAMRLTLFLLHWSEPPASPIALHRLVNDLRSLIRTEVPRMFDYLTVAPPRGAETLEPARNSPVSGGC